MTYEYLPPLYHTPSAPQKWHSSMGAARGAIRGVTGWRRVYLSDGVSIGGADWRFYAVPTKEAKRATDFAATPAEQRRLGGPHYIETIHQFTSERAANRAGFTQHK